MRRIGLATILLVSLPVIGGAQSRPGPAALEPHLEIIARTPDEANRIAPRHSR